MTEKQTVAGAYIKIENHELECTLRYQALEGAIGRVNDETSDIKKGIRAGLAILGSMALSLIVWLASQLYDNVQQDIEDARRAPYSAASTVGLE